MTTCPSCGGSGKSEGFVDGFKDGKHWGEWREWTCLECRGTGDVTVEFLRRKAERRIVRDRRIDRHETQREAADRLGVDWIAYSKWEYGHMETLGSEELDAEASK